MKRKVKAYGATNQLNLRVVIGFYRSYFRVNRSTQKLMMSYHLTLSQFGVLEALYHLGDMNIGDIISKTLSTSGNMTVVIKNLEKEGWITRYTDPRDGRAYLVQITDKGNALIETIFPEHLKDLEQVLGNLEPEEKKQLIYLLKKMNGV